MRDSGQAIRRKKATLDRVLVYYDGPQVLALAGARKSHWLCVAVPLPAGDTRKYPIFCVQVTGDELGRFARGQVDLSYFFRFREVKDFRLGDLGAVDNGEIFLEAVEPRKEWWPQQGFFMEPESTVLQAANVSDRSGSSGRVLTIPIDGEWEFPEFAAFSDYTSDCYSFLYSIDAARRGVASRETIATLTRPYEAYPWKGGASPLHMYADLYSRTPAHDRLNIRSISYASPGEIQLGGSASIFSQISSALRAMQSNYYSSRGEYNTLRQFLSKEGFLRASRDAIRGTQIQQDIVKDRTERLSGLVGFEGVSTLHAHTDHNWILTAKILLSYYRRLWKLFRFYAEGRASAEGMLGLSGLNQPSVPMSPPQTHE